MSAEMEEGTMITRRVMALIIGDVRIRKELNKKEAHHAWGSGTC